MERGSSLIETLVVLGLSVIALSAVTVFGANLALSSAHLVTQAKAEIAAASAYIEITRALANFDTHRLPAGLLLSPAESARTFDGRPHPVLALRGTSAPRARSVIVSTLGLSLEHAGRVDETIFQGSNYLAQVCFESPPRASDLFRSYIVLAPSRTIQVVVAIEWINHRCGRVSATPVRGVFFPSSSQAEGWSYIIPVQSEYSLFVDRSSTLRYVAHVGSRIIENQPLVSGISRIGPQFNQPSTDTTALALSIQPIGGKVHSWTHLFSLGRRSPIEVAFE